MKTNFWLKLFEVASPFLLEYRRHLSDSAVFCFLYRTVVVLGSTNVFVAFLFFHFFKNCVCFFSWSCIRPCLSFIDAVDGIVSERALKDLIKDWFCKRVFIAEIEWILYCYPFDIWSSIDNDLLIFSVYLLSKLLYDNFLDFFVLVLKLLELFLNRLVPTDSNQLY